MNDLQTAAKEGDQEGVSFHCHKMKSVMKMMGFDNIAEALEAIEKEKPIGDLLARKVQLVDDLIGLSLVAFDD